MASMHEQVNHYKDNFYKDFNTREETEDDYSQYLIKEKRNHKVGKGAGQIRFSWKNLTIFIQFLLIVALLVMMLCVDHVA